MNTQGAVLTSIGNSKNKTGTDRITANSRSSSGKGQMLFERCSSCCRNASLLAVSNMSCCKVFGADYRLFSHFGYIFYVLSMPIESTKELCAYGRFLNGKRSWCFWGVRNSLGGAKWQAIFLTWRSDSPPLFPKTLTLVFLKALMRTNEYAGRSSHKHK